MIVKGPEFALASNILQLFKHYPFLSLKRIDLSNAFSKSLGKREIVLLIEDAMSLAIAKKTIQLTFPKYLRLSEKNYSQQLANFLVLRDKMHIDYRKQVRRFGKIVDDITFAPKVIDMRIGELAFVEK